MSASARKWIRHGSAALIVGTIAAIALLAGHRIRQLSRPMAEVDTDQMLGAADDPVQGVYHGQRYVETVAGQLIFVLNSVRTLGKSSGWHEIEGVQLQLYSEGQPGPLLTCDSARFNVETREAELRGPVTAEFPGGAILNTEGAHFDAAQRRFVADSRVLFTNGESIGQAGHAVYWIEDNRLELVDNAVLQTGEGFALRAPRIVYHRQTQRIALPEGCLIQRDGAEITAPRAFVELSGEEGTPQRIGFPAGVTARSGGGPDRPAIEATAERVVAEIDPDGNWQVEATSRSTWINVVMRGGSGFFERSIRTLRLGAVVGSEGVLSIRGDRGVCVEEVPTEGDVRRAEAAAARLWFEDGDATDMELVEDVVVHGEGITAKGHQGRFSSATGVAMLRGGPSGAQRAVLSSDQGVITCDQLQMFDREGRTELRGNVQGRLEEVGLLGAEPANAPSPLHFAADVLEVTGSGSTMRLRDNARLWQGHRLLLADDVVYTHSDGQLLASGHVRTTMPAIELDPQAGPDQDVVVVARSLDFSDVRRRAIYRGTVHYSDPQHTLSANELEISFDDHNIITTVEAVGAVELFEQATGRRITGQTARREVADGLVYITGSPVQVTDASGTVISSSSLTWDQASGSVTVAGGTEAIYYPEETP